MTGSRLLGIFIVVTVLAIGAGLYLLGSPSTMRGRRLDERRVRDLEDITFRVNRLWERDGALPSTPAALVAPTEAPLPVDPVSQQPYEYRPLGADRFELCARFELPSTDESATRDGWFHPAGRQCFERKARNVSR